MTTKSSFTNERGKSFKEMMYVKIILWKSYRISLLVQKENKSQDKFAIALTLNWRRSVQIIPQTHTYTHTQMKRTNNFIITYFCVLFYCTLSQQKAINLKLNLIHVTCRKTFVYNKTVCVWILVGTIVYDIMRVKSVSRGTVAPF